MQSVFKKLTLGCSKILQEDIIIIKKKKKIPREQIETYFTNCIVSRSIFTKYKALMENFFLFWTRKTVEKNGQGQKAVKSFFLLTI